MPKDSDLSFDEFWMPFTENRRYKSQPRLLCQAKDMHYTAGDGHDVLDATSGLWCVNAGHSRVPIVAAIQRQAAELDFAPTFQLGHPLAFQLAHRLKSFFPGDINHSFFAGSGSEAVDSALKIAVAYQRAIGFPDRTRFVGRERGYHGVGFGGISVGGLPKNREGFPMLPGIDHLPHTHDLAKMAFSRNQPDWGAELADALEEIIALRGAETIAAVIVEPMSGSSGVLVPPKGYLERLREITRRHGILLIFDEVITGFGRLGAPTASALFGVQPDLITVAKGITNGAVPMGCVGVSDTVYSAVMSKAGPGIEFFHGYTYSGHPLAAAAALACLDVYEQEGLFTRAASLDSVWENAAHALRDAPFVRDIRNIGLVAGIELEPRPDHPGARAMEIFHRCFDTGLLIRVTGDTIALSPPLIISEEQIHQIFDQLAAVIRQVN